MQNAASASIIAAASENIQQVIILVTTKTGYRKRQQACRPSLGNVRVYVSETTCFSLISQHSDPEAIGLLSIRMRTTATVSVAAKCGDSPFQPEALDRIIPKNRNLKTMTMNRKLNEIYRKWRRLAS